MVRDVSTTVSQSTYADSMDIEFNDTPTSGTDFVSSTSGSYTVQSGTGTGTGTDITSESVCETSSVSDSSSGSLSYVITQIYMFRCFMKRLFAHWRCILRCPLFWMLLLILALIALLLSWSSFSVCARVKQSAIVIKNYTMKFAHSIASVCA